MVVQIFSLEHKKIERFRRVILIAYESIELNSTRDKTFKKFKNRYLNKLYKMHLSNA